MTNDTTTFILDYAAIHRNFSIEDLFAYLHERNGINRASLSWYLFKLVNENVLVRTGRGMYAKVLKQAFAPKPAEEVKEVYNLLQANFPFAKFCVYQGEIIAPLQHHLSSNRVIYVETDRNSTETVFNFLKDGSRDVYLRPNKEMIYRYVDMDSRVCFVKNLVSEAPLQKVSGVLMPTLEKLIVDILRDTDFFYLQGSESDRIIENAFNLYAVNQSRLFRYAGRRKVKEELSSILENLNIQ
ncbi:DUF6577 family protein [Bacteroides salyersiae]|uniref:DUF6577 family protein n=1 Tax=Bacteroides salyersiae TaxID=291644 RepID=UPI001C8C3042|nr:DUF6577 family protein [Bacteroides salyersiae]